MRREVKHFFLYLTPGATPAHASIIFESFRSYTSTRQQENIFTLKSASERIELGSHLKSLRLSPLRFSPGSSLRRLILIKRHAHSGSNRESFNKPFRHLFMVLGSAR